MRHRQLRTPVSWTLHFRRVFTRSLQSAGSNRSGVPYLRGIRSVSHLLVILGRALTGNLAGHRNQRKVRADLVVQVCCNSGADSFDSELLRQSIAIHMAAQRRHLCSCDRENPMIPRNTPMTQRFSTLNGLDDTAGPSLFFELPLLLNLPSRGPD